MEIKKNHVKLMGLGADNTSLNIVGWWHEITKNCNK